MSTNHGTQVHTPFATYDAAASIAVSNAQEDTEGCFYNPVRHGSGWAVEVLNFNAEFYCYL